MRIHVLNVNEVPSITGYKFLRYYSYITQVTWTCYKTNGDTVFNLPDLKDSASDYGTKKGRKGLFNQFF